MVADLIKFHIDPHKHACIHYLKSRRHSFQFSKYEWVKTFDLHFWLSTFCLHNKSLNKEHTYFLYAYIIFVNTFAFVGLPSTTHHHPKNITLFILYSFYKISIDRLYNAGNKPCYAYKHNHTARDNKYYYDFWKKSKLKKVCIIYRGSGWYSVWW